MPNKETLQNPLEFPTSDVTQRRKFITLFKIGKLWVFKYFFEDKETFRALAEYYDKDKYRFEFKSFGARNEALKILEREGYDYELIEDLKPFIVKLDKFSKYAQVLKNSVAYAETPNERIFLMNDLAAVEEALRLGAEKYEDDF